MCYNEKYSEKQIKEMKSKRLEGSMCFVHKAQFVSYEVKKFVAGWTDDGTRDGLQKWYFDRI